MKHSPIILTAGLLALASVANANETKAPTYTANPVYNAPSIQGSQANITGAWSPIGLDPMDFTAIVSLAYNSESTYSLQATQITGTGTGVGAHDSYIYSIVSDDATPGDVVTLSINYGDIGATGPESGVFWDEDPGFKVNRSLSSDSTDYTAMLNQYDVNQVHSVFNEFSAQFTVTETGDAVDIPPGEDPPKGGDSKAPTTFSSDGVIFTSAKAGPVAWNATGSPASVPEPSSTILLGVAGGLLTLRRKR